MKYFYVSLVYDLLGCYLRFEAVSEVAVRDYLYNTYYDEGADVWKMPWCSVYTDAPSGSTVIPAACGRLYE